MNLLKNKKKFALIFFCVVIVWGVTVYGDKLFLKKQPKALVEINSAQFKVEIAQTSSTRYQGLSDRQELAKNSGMLFIFEDYQVRNFIMRNMNFPLDIVRIKDNLVIHCSKNMPILAQNGNFSRITSKSAVNHVLELNAGICEEFNIQPGDSVDIQYLK